MPKGAVETEVEYWLQDESGRYLLTDPPPVYRRHDLHTGFGTERENLVPDAKENDKWPTS